MRAARTTTGIVTPIAIFAPDERPLLSGETVLLGKVENVGLVTENLDVGDVDSWVVRRESISVSVDSYAANIGFAWISESVGRGLVTKLPAWGPVVCMTQTAVGVPKGAPLHHPKNCVFPDMSQERPLWYRTRELSWNSTISIAEVSIV
jgi:hypothetical protein